jgi:hypothetical protein
MFKEEREEDRKLQDIYYNYYQAYYHPLRLVREFAQSYYSESIPVFLGFVEGFDDRDFVEGFDERAMPAYLDKFDIPYQFLRYYDKPVFDLYDHIHVIVSYPIRFSRTFSQAYPEAHCTMLNTEVGFHNVYLCQKNAKSP